jgi:nicotinamidase-related amidase
MEQLYVGDVLLLADVQNDFLPGGALGIKGGDEVVPVLRGYMDRFRSRGLPILRKQISAGRHSIATIRPYRNRGF